MMNKKDKMYLIKEVMREAYAELVFGFLRYFRENNIDKNDINNPIVKIFNITLDIYKNIYSLRYNTLEAMIEVQGQYKLIKQWFTLLEKSDGYGKK